MAKEIDLTLKPGDRAPEFTAAASGGRTISLLDLRGSRVVLFFYPRDNTPGCNKEACSFRDEHDQLAGRGVVVLGVSTDSIASHEKFTKKFNLPFPLLADENAQIVKAYGVWGQKQFLGRKYMGTHRVTFLIGEDGVIQKIWPKVKPEGHAREILDALDSSFDT